MKTLLFIILVGIVIEIHAQTPVQAKGIHQVEWLIGQWKRTNAKPGRSSVETWKKDRDQLVGFAVNMNGRDTTYVEKLKIVFKDNTLYYVADVPQNKSEVYFKLTELSESGFVCENPQHDFPKKIRYERTGSGLRAVISGDGKEIPYLFEKM